MGNVTYEWDYLICRSSVFARSAYPWFALLVCSQKLMYGNCMSRLVVVMAFLSSILVVQAAQAQYASQWFSVDMDCSFDSSKASCRILNTGNTSMFCNLQAYGMQPYGYYLYSYFNDWIPPGQYRDVYVYTYDPYRPFVNASGSGNCYYRQWNRLNGSGSALGALISRRQVCPFCQVNKNIWTLSWCLEASALTPGRSK